MTRCTLAILAVAALACGARSELWVTSQASDAGRSVDGASSLQDATAIATCVPFGAIPPPSSQPVGAACTWGGSATSPVLAAIDGQELLVLSPALKLTSPFEFAIPVANIVSSQVTSRGEFLGAIVVGSNPDETTLDVELVLLRTDGTVLAHHRETLTPPRTNAGIAFGVVGNAGGTFAFGASLGDVGKTWVAAASGALLGPFTGVAFPEPSLQVDPDVRGRFLVLPLGAISTEAVDWLDPCTGASTPARLPMQGTDVAAWGAKLFGAPVPGPHGASTESQPSVETADGVSALATGPIDGNLWDFNPAGQAMFAVPPFPSGLTANANLLILDVASIAQHTASLGYPGLLVIPGNAWVSEVGVSNDPAGFGLDSAGNVTMFLTDETGATHLDVTRDGSSWTPIGAAIGTDPSEPPSEGLAFVEAGGTYAIGGVSPTLGGRTWQVARPSSGVSVAVSGAPRVAGDGGCVSVFVAPTELDLVNATTGDVVTLSLPVAPTAGGWSATWIPGDDAVLFDP